LLRLQLCIGSVGSAWEYAEGLWCWLNRRFFQTFVSRQFQNYVGNDARVDRNQNIISAKGGAMVQEETIRAHYEKQLVAFLRDFLGKQPSVKFVPAITVVY
jgi:hypothetical protein